METKGLFSIVDELLNNGPGNARNAAILGVSA